MIIAACADSLSLFTQCDVFSFVLNSASMSSHLGGSLMNLRDCIELRKSVYITHCPLCYRFLSKQFLLLTFLLCIDATPGKLTLLVKFKNTAAKATFFSPS